MCKTAFYYDKENWPDNEIILFSDKELSSKLTILLALTIASRASGIQHLNLKNMIRLRDCHLVSPVVRIFVYTVDPALYIFKCLIEYLVRPKKWRG